MQQSVWMLILLTQHQNQIKSERERKEFAKFWEFTRNTFRMLMEGKIEIIRDSLRAGLLCENDWNFMVFSSALITTAAVSCFFYVTTDNSGFHVSLSYKNCAVNIVVESKSNYLSRQEPHSYYELFTMLGCKHFNRQHINWICACCKAFLWTCTVIKLLKNRRRLQLMRKVVWR